MAAIGTAARDPQGPQRGLSTAEAWCESLLKHLEPLVLFDSHDLSCRIVPKVVLVVFEKAFKTTNGARFFIDGVEIFSPQGRGGPRGVEV